MSGLAWRSLGIEPTTDLAAIKRAYAAQLKAIDRERDIEAFQALRSAYEEALATAAGAARDAEADAIKLDGGALRFEVQLAESDSADDQVAPALPHDMDGFDAHVDQLAQRLIAMALDANADAGALQRELVQTTVLDSFGARHEISERLVEALHGEAIAVAKLDVLADAFHWMDSDACTGAVAAREVSAWVRGQQLIHRLEHDATVPARARNAWKALRRHLGRGTDWKRAFTWAIVPAAEYRLELAYSRLDTYLKGEANLVLAEEERLFLAELVSKRWTSGISWATVLARAICYPTITVLLAWVYSGQSQAGVGEWLLWWPKGFVIAATMILSWRTMSSIREISRGHENKIAYAGFALMFLFVFLPELWRLYGPGS